MYGNEPQFRLRLLPLFFFVVVFISFFGFDFKHFVHFLCGIPKRKFFCSSLLRIRLSVSVSVCVFFALSYFLTAFVFIFVFSHIWKSFSLSFFKCQNINSQVYNLLLLTSPKTITTAATTAATTATGRISLALNS